MNRSWLYVPGDRVDRVAKAASLDGSSRPDAVIFDLEDAVAPTAKADARATVVAALTTWATGAPEAWVRINGSGEWCTHDVALVAPARPAGVVLPKATTQTLGAVARLLDDAGGADLPIVALVESAQGLIDAPAMARHPRVRNLAIGEIDLCAELGIIADPATLVPLRLQLVVASAAAGIAAPTGPVAIDFRNLNALADSTAGLRAIGFGARSAIHPDQVGVINAEFTPTDDELAAARELVDRYDAALAAGIGVVVDDSGRMVDEAVVRRARSMLRP